MKKHFKKRRSQRSRPSRQEQPFRTWSGRAPIAESDYPFESAIVAEGFHEVLQRNMGPGIRIYTSTECISAANTIDALLLTMLGEQFREFFSDPMPWLNKTTTELCVTPWFDENDAEEIKNSLARLAKSGFIDLDTSTPGICRYRLNVEAVRQAKNEHFVPMSELEWIDDEYLQRFSDLHLQKRAFACICGRNVALGRLMLNLWHLSLSETTREALRNSKQGLAWIDIERYSAFRDEPLFAREEDKWQAFEALIQKRFLEVRQSKHKTREYRPDARRIWEALDALPKELTEMEEMDGNEDL